MNKEIAEKILESLSDRRGFSDLIDNLDEDIRNEIIRDISSIVEKVVFDHTINDLEENIIERW